MAWQDTMQKTGEEDEWKPTVLGELCEFRAGSVFKRQYQGQNTGDYPFIKVSDMNLPMNRICIRGSNNWIDQDIADLIKAKSLPADTIVFAKIGEALKHNRLRRLIQPTIIDNNMMGAIPNQEMVIPGFLYYAMHQFDFGEVATGTAVPYLTVSSLVELQLNLPPLSEQRAIAHMLGTLDDKIELNRRMNETLEEMARALFKSWFVDFEPVRAKMEGRWRKGESLPGMPAELYELFPDGMVDSELGEIPAGWEVRSLSECIDVARGLSYKGAGLSSDGVPMHNLNSIFEGGGYKDDGIKYYDGAYKSRHVAQSGDVIVANTEQGHLRLLIGFAAIVPQRFGDDGLFSHHLYKVRPNSSLAITPDFVCQLLNTSAMQDTVSGYATGTTVNMLPGDALKIPSIVVPPYQLIQAFSAIAKATRIKQEQCIVESRSLTFLRDTLLPKLVSGEMRLKQAELLLAGGK